MNILVTGAKGFVGKNLVANLRNIAQGKNRTRPNLHIEEIFEYDLDTDPALLGEYCARADFVYHLAGVNRPQNNEEFMEGNFGFSSTLLETLKKTGNKCPVLLSSSIQATLIGRYGKSDYGRSKLAGEELFKKYSEETGVKVLIYRFPNLFGKWCRPNYNSAVATFSSNIANGLPIQVNDRSTELELLYIDDLVEEMILALSGKEHRDEKGYCFCPVTFKKTLGEIVDLLYSFKESRRDLSVPDMSDGFTKRLYANYLSYLPADGFSYKLKMNRDVRGSFTEILRTADRGQVSVNISRPGITKGQHWHHTKNEKFVDFVKGVAATVAKANPADLDALMECKYDGTDMTVTQQQQEMVLVIGENIKVRRFAFYTDGVSVAYVHAGGKIGVLVNLETSLSAEQVEAVGKDVAMQIAALNPRFWDKSQVGQDVLDEEKKIMLVQMANDPKMASKPEKVKEGIVAGKLGKFYKENCLLQQEFVKDGSMSVEKYIESSAKALGGKVSFKDAVRFEKGEGIEKKQDDFAAEVASMAK